MTREFILDGLDCANCAGAIEKAVGKLDGVQSASMSFATATLRVETNSKKLGALNQAIKETVYHYEPDVTVYEKNEKTQESGQMQTRFKLIRLILAAAILALAVILQRLLTQEIISLVVFLVAYALIGGRIIIRAARNILRGKIFDENFLMTIATLGAIVLGEYAEAVVVMLFYGVGEFFQERAVGKSKKSIAALMNLRPDHANLYKDGQIVKVDPESVLIGNTIVVMPGEKIPLDGFVIEGKSMLDTSSLTGESVPRAVNPSDTVLSGCINVDGVLTIEVTKAYGESTVAKIIDLVENAAHKKAPTEQFITKFARYYTPVVVALALLISVIPPLLFGGYWDEWVRRGLIFLVISCPCALVVSIPLGYFGGIGAASKRGVLFKGSNYLEALCNLDIAVFDKTGTLTKGVFMVTSLLPENNFSAEELLETAALAESYSTHPIAKSISQKYGKEIDRGKLTDYHELAGYGVSVRYEGRRILVGNLKLMEKMGIEASVPNNYGACVYIAVDDVLAGYIIVSDEIKRDSHKTISALKEKGVRKTIMLTGDTAGIANTVASELALDEVYANLLPDQKVAMVEHIQTQKRPKGKLAFVGDGINDAPVLAIADIGVAMGGLGSDAAIEAADVVLMTDEPYKLVEAVNIARFTRRIVWQNIIFALGIKGLFLILGAIGVSSMWEAIFADVGVSILAIFNAMRVMRGAY